MSYYCREWKSSYVKVELKPPGLRRRGDFFVVEGVVENVGPCILRHPQLKLYLRYAGLPRPLLQDVFHLTERALHPGRRAPFRLEGEYEEAMIPGSARVELWLIEDGRH
ncbi:MAG: hypothetical protein GF399_11190 [Candidatus Coatesbacteria bacterium]|nr:hypothetical protein [Candidatus Coatesbacteria bacterium]